MTLIKAEMRIFKSNLICTSSIDIDLRGINFRFSNIDELKGLISYALSEKFGAANVIKLFKLYVVEITTTIQSENGIERISYLQLPK